MPKTVLATFLLSRFGERVAETEAKKRARSTACNIFQKKRKDQRQPLHTSLVHAVGRCKASTSRGAWGSTRAEHPRQPHRRRTIRP